MTWQRIDENTYIDDTLVTCAEYQLFIDEMREQGKYYQPDHWTSYQFPAEQAREPILGMRLSDAGAFCKWLMQKNSNDWQYRLPTYHEANLHQIQSDNHQKLLGYWIGESERAFHLFFINSLLATPITSNSPRPNYLDIECGRVSDEINKIIMNGSRIRYDIKKARDLIEQIDKIVNRNFDHSNWATIQPLISHFLRVSRSLDVVVNTYMLNLEILNWQDRIIGRSPAFEGIRLVKERIK